MWVVSLVITLGPADLHLAIHKAEKIEMDWNFALGGQIGKKIGNLYRGKGRF